MKSKNREKSEENRTKILTNTSFFLILLHTVLCTPVWGAEEVPLTLPKTEGSKNFDLEIDKLNDKGIEAYKKKKFEQARGHFQKASNLAKQFRDPSQGVVNYNLALSLHQLANHEEAIKQFYSARRYARGNQNILKSKLLKMYECGLNQAYLAMGKYHYR